MRPVPATASAGPAFCEALLHRFPGREQQVKTLTTLVDVSRKCTGVWCEAQMRKHTTAPILTAQPSLAPCGNIVIHGTEASGKTSVTTGVLETIASNTPNTSTNDDSVSAHGPSIDYAIIDSNKCVTTRHLFERTVANVADAMRRHHPSGPPPPQKCETLSQLAVELSKLLNKYGDLPSLPPDWRFVLVFDAVDRQRDAPLTLLPGLARLSEVVPSLTVVFIVTFPPPSMLRASFVPHIQFGNYSKAEFVEIMSRTPPPALANATADETAELWVRLCTAVHDSLTRTAGRTLTAFQEACTALWPKFTAPILAGTHGPREFSKLLIASRVHFQDESLLDPGFVVARPAAGSSLPKTGEANGQQKDSSDPLAARHLASLLPTAARLFLLCAYLASHNAGRHDITLFSTYYHGRKRKHGGAAGLGALGGARQGPRSKHRKIARKLLGAHSFTLERMLAIYAAVRSEWTRAAPLAATGRNSAAAIMDGDCHMAIATLASLRLVLRVSGQASDTIDRAGKWRVNVGWEVVRSLGRSMGIEMEDWLVD